MFSDVHGWNSEIKVNTVLWVLYTVYMYGSRVGIGFVFLFFSFMTLEMSLRSLFIFSRWGRGVAWRAVVNKMFVPCIKVKINYKIRSMSGCNDNPTASTILKRIQY